jgi:hypothetical protein
MIIGAHSIISSTKPDADRAFLRDTLALTSVDVGGGWSIFGLPPAELAVHPSERNGVHELYLMCDDVEAFVAAMRTRHIACDPVKDQGWGLLTRVAMPSGATLGVYEPRHARPEAMTAAPATARRARRATKTRAKTTARRLSKRKNMRRR